MAQNSPLSIRCFVMCSTESWTACTHGLYGFVLSNPSCARRISSISKQELPQFLFSSPEKKRMREKVEEDWSTMGVGWDADKVDYEVFPSYLLGTRLSLVIKSVLLFYSSEVGLVSVEHYELIAFDNGDEGPNVACQTESLVRQCGALRYLKAAEGAEIVAMNLQDSGDGRLDIIIQYVALPLILYLYVDLKQVILSRERHRERMVVSWRQSSLVLFTRAVTVLFLGHFMVGDHEISAKCPFFQATELLSRSHFSTHEQAC